MWDAAMRHATQALPEVVCLLAATFMLCVLFHALKDPEVRLCVLGTGPDEGDAPQRREIRRKSSPEAAMRQQGGESGERKSSPEAAMRQRGSESGAHKSSPEAAMRQRGGESGPRKSSPEAARREGAVPSAQRAPRRQDDLGARAPAPPKDRRTCAPGTRVTETSSTSQAMGSVRRRGGEKETMGPAEGRSGTDSLAKLQTLLQSCEAVCPDTSRVVRSGVLASSSWSVSPAGPTSTVSTVLGSGGLGPLHTGNVEEPGPLSEEVIRKIVKPLRRPLDHEGTASM